MKHTVTVEFEVKGELNDVPGARVANAVLNVLVPESRRQSVTNVRTTVETG